MTITLSKAGTTVNLPSDLIWTDRHTWSPVEQNVSTSITGAAIVDLGERVNGRPITLEGDEGHAWFSYSLLSTLKAWAAEADTEMTLTIDGTGYTVLWRHQDKPALDVLPVVDYAIPDAQDWFYGALKFMEI